VFNLDGYGADEDLSEDPPEDPPEDPDGDGPSQVYSDRAWFGSRADNSAEWGLAWLSRGGHFLTERHKELERADDGPVKVRKHRKRWWQ
jgi:hypothetical protein